MLGEPPRTSGDLQFGIAGFPIRITPSFWLASVLLGWQSSQGNPHQLLAWVSAVLLSILIHELGHAAAFRYYAIPSYVVLYHFGGVAVPITSNQPWNGKGYNAIVVSAAGPAAQMLAAVVLGALLMFGGYGVPIHGFVQDWLRLPVAPSIANPVAWTFIQYFMYISVYWALLNLLPIYPLDGGQISRELFLRWDKQDALKHSLILSMIAAGAMALKGFTQNDTYLGIMFGMLAFSSYSALQTSTGASGAGRGW